MVFDSDSAAGRYLSCMYLLFIALHPCDHLSLSVVILVNRVKIMPSAQVGIDPTQNREYNVYFVMHLHLRPLADY